MAQRKHRSRLLPGAGLASRRTAAAALLLLTGISPATLGAQTAAAGADSAEVAVDPAAKAALDRMGAYLRSVQAFEADVTSTREEVLESGLKVQSDWVTNLVVRKPDRLLAHVQSDSQDRWFFYNGRLFTLWANRADLYATVDAPPTLGGLIQMLEEKLEIEVPLVDLFRWGTAEATTGEITQAVDLGPATIGGTTCHQYAFRQEGLDWQIWIQEGDFPLPRKLVLTTTSDDARPQFVATYSWNLAPSYNDAGFTFDPPADAHRITFATAAPAAGEKQ